MRSFSHAFSLGIAMLVVGCGGGGSSTAAKFNPYFVTEWGPTAYNSAAAASNDDDAGPATLVMVISARGVIAAPTSTTAEAAIVSMRALALGGNAPPAAPTTAQDLLNALSDDMLVADDMDLKGAAASLDQDITQINGVIEDHCYVHVAGDPGDAWGRSLDSAGHYLHHYASATDTFTHWITVFGREPSGEYIVGDPLATEGVFDATVTQLRQYLSDGGAAAAGINVFPLDP